MVGTITILSELETLLNTWTPWMYWKAEVFIFLLCFFCLFLGGLAIADLKKRSRPRKGFLPFPTTRGDRIFIGVILWVVIFLVTAAIDLPYYISIIAGVITVVIVVLKG
jgi:predicted small integral membrane protein